MHILERLRSTPITVGDLGCSFLSDERCCRGIGSVLCCVRPLIGAISRVSTWLSSSSTSPCSSLCHVPRASLLLVPLFFALFFVRLPFFCSRSSWVYVTSTDAGLRGLWVEGACSVSIGAKICTCTLVAQAARTSGLCEPFIEFSSHQRFALR